jgi:hypothetical protein
MDGAVHVLLNRGGPGHWLRVRLQDRGANRAALGALVTVEAGGRTWSAEVRTSGGFQASVPAEVHFGLGEVEAIDRVTVRWPDGEVTEHTGLALDHAQLLLRPEASGEER